jgi:hypothetical protein
MIARDLIWRIREGEHGGEPGRFAQHPKGPFKTYQAKRDVSIPSILYLRPEGELQCAACTGMSREVNDVELRRVADGRQVSANPIVARILLAERL